VADSHVLQFDRVHQVMKCHMRVTAAETSEEWSHQAAERYQWIAAKGAEQEIKPNHVGLQPVQRSEQAVHASRIIEGPASNYGEPFELDMIRRQFIP